jgi:hypothetical protein
MASGRTCPLSNKVNDDVFADCTAERALPVAPTCGASLDGAVPSGEEVQDSNAAVAAACSAIRSSREMRLEKRILITIPFLECLAV